MEEDLVVLCQALYQSIGEEEWSGMHESLKEVGVKKAGRRIAALGNLAWRKSEKDHLFSSERDFQVAILEGVIVGNVETGHSVT